MSPHDIAFDHAWKCFEYHANQRMSLLRFFLITTGAVTAAYATAYRTDFYELSFVAAIFGAVASYCFYCLDKRAAHLVKLAEAVLDREQARLKGLVGYDEILIVKASDRKKPGRLRSNRQIFAFFMWATIALYAVGILFAAGKWAYSG